MKTLAEIFYSIDANFYNNEA